MYNFIPQIAIIVSLLLITFIVVKKFVYVNKLDKDKELEEYIQKKSIKFRTLKLFTFLWKEIRSLGRGVGSLFSLLGKKAPSVADSLLKKAKRGKKKTNTASGAANLINNRPIGVSPTVSSVTSEDKAISSLFAKASTYQVEKNYKEAEKTFIRIIKQDPHSIQAYKGLAKLYTLQNNLNDAKLSYKQALKISPNDEESLRELKRLP